MTDRERLDQLAQERHRERQQREQQQEQDRRDAAASLEAVAESEKAKTAELAEWCRATFAGYRLAETGHEVSVSTAGSSRLHGVQADRVEYVTLTISHWGRETNDFQGQIPLVLARFHSGRYEVVADDGERTTFGPLEEAKAHILGVVADIGRGRLLKLFERVRGLPRR